MKTQIEIEKKFIVSKPIIKRFLQSSKIVYTKHNLTQFYLFAQNGCSLRLRKQDNTYSLCIKSGLGSMRSESESIIRKNLYKEYLDKHIGQKIEKTRYLFTIDDDEYAIDAYKKDFLGLVVMEVEFSSEQKFSDFVMPPAIAPFIIDDVSEDERYKNYNLSLFGLPKLATTLSEHTSVYDALQQLFGDFLQTVLEKKEQILHHNEEEDLHQFRVELRKCRAIVKEFQDFFKEDAFKKANKALRVIAQTTNKKRDLDVFYDSIKHKNELQEFIDYIHKTKEEQHQLLEHFFCDGEFARLLKIIQDNLQHKKSYLKKSKNQTMNQIFKQKIQNKKDAIQNEIKQLTHASPIEHLHEIRIEFKKLRYMLESFMHLITDNESMEFLKESKWYQNMLGALNDISVQLEIILHYKHSNKASDALEHFTTMLEEKLQQLKKQIIDKVVEKKGEGD
jgi:CHAD domain-containing protein/CYTH domain-containing protein